MRIINLMPHAIVLRSENGETTVAPSGEVARVSTTPGVVIQPEGFPCAVASATVYGDLEGLPLPQTGVIYLVSALVLARCHGRTDVFGPGTGPSDGAIRNEKGQVIAVTRLIAAPLN